MLAIRMCGLAVSMATIKASLIGMGIISMVATSGCDLPYLVNRSKHEGVYYSLFCSGTEKKRQMTSKIDIITRHAFAIICDGVEIRLDGLKIP